MMSESLVVIRTYGNLLDADEAQIELLDAGIYSLLLSDERGHATAELPVGIGLAVHRRDVEIAEAVLAPRSNPA